MIIFFAVNGAETVMSMCKYLDDGWVASAEKVIPELKNSPRCSFE